METKEDNQLLQKASKSKDFDSPRNSKKDKKIPEVDKEDGLKPMEEEKETKIAGEKKAEEKKEKKKEKEERPRKTSALVKVQNVKISTKHSIAVCKAIRRKKIDTAIEFLLQVLKKKKAVPMKGEIPHRKGMERGRYPENACKEIIKLLRSLRSNAIQNGLDIDKIRITGAVPNIGNRPYKRFGREKMKRTHIYLEAK